MCLAGTREGFLEGVALPKSLPSWGEKSLQPRCQSDLALLSWPLAAT